MSIYDNLADSDFIDKGKFKAQLKEMGHNTEKPLGESQDDIIDDYEDNDLNTNDLEVPDYLRERLEDEEKRQNYNTKDSNPMDFINEQSLMNKVTE
jgi:hypothetical protein